MTLGGVVAVGLAQAQSSDGVPPDRLPRITVTGSHIARSQASDSEFVEVLTADDLRRSGYTTLWQVLSTVTANGQGSLSQNFSRAAAIGASGISLRGLGVGATLVLIDGYRTAPYPIGDDNQRAFVDIGSLPLDAVDRVEILRDGASAAYGSDAIAGVVNVILRKSFEGSRLGANVGTSSRGDGSAGNVTATFGAGDLDRDGHNVYVSAEFRHQREIRFADRGGMFTRSDYRSSGGYDITPGVPNAINGGLPNTPTGYITDSAGRVVGFMPGCDASRLSSGGCSYRDRWSQIQPETENHNVVVKATQQLTPSWQIALQATFFESRAEQSVRPATTFTGGYQGVTSGAGTVPTLLAPVAPTTIGVGNPGFPAGSGVASGLLHYALLDVGPNRTQSDAQTRRLITEVKGAYAGWDISAAAGISEVVLRLRGRGNVQAASLQTAIDSASAPYVVGGPNDAAVLDSLAPTLYTRDVSRMSFFRLGAGRDLIALAAGPLSTAFGFELLRFHKSQVAPDDVAAGLVDSFNNGFATGTQKSGSFYIEAAAPLSRQIETDAAIRYDRYSISGGRFSPKIGIRYAAARVLSFHGTFGTGFRAPGPDENGNAGSTFTAGRSRDPLLCPDASDPGAAGNFSSQCAVRVATVLGSSPSLRPETSRSLAIGAAIGAESDLSLSADYYRIAIRNQIVTGSAADVVRGTNLSPLVQVQPDGSVALVAPPIAPIAYFHIGYVNANRTTTSGFDVHLRLRHRFEGIGDYRSDLSATIVDRYDLTVGGVTYKLAGTHGPLVVSGDTGNPRTRFKWINRFTRGSLSLTATVNYISPFDLTDPSVGVTDCVSGLTVGAGGAAYSQQLANGTVPSGVACRVKSFKTFDLSASWDATKRLTYRLSVLNLFNARAPEDWGTYAGNGEPYNPSLHSQGAIGRYFSSGLTYTF